MLFSSTGFRQRNARSGPRPAVAVLCGLLLLALFAPRINAGSAVEAGQYQSVADFLSESFNGQQPEAKVFWLSAELKQRIKILDGKAFPLLRVRYWQLEHKTAWILEEIGKEMPITIGVVVRRDGVSANPIVEQVSVLAFRESRGWEIRHDFFTEQFRGVRLTQDDRLNQHIDGITGATLSVNAVSKVSRVALILANAVQPWADYAAVE